MKTIRYIILLTMIIGAPALKAGNPRVVVTPEKKGVAPAALVINLPHELPKEAFFEDFPFVPDIRFDTSFVVQVHMIHPDVQVSVWESPDHSYSWLAPEVPLEADFE